MSSTTKMAVICAVAVGAAVFVGLAGRRSLDTMSYSEFLEKVGTGQVAGVTLWDRNSGAVPAICRLKDGTAVRTVLPSDYRDAMASMQARKVQVEIRGWAWGSVANAAPFLVLLVVWIVLLICKFPAGPFRTLWR